jgi:hypothetical protein
MVVAPVPKTQIIGPETLLLPTLYLAVGTRIEEKEE